MVILFALFIFPRHEQYVQNYGAISGHMKSSLVTNIAWFSWEREIITIGETDERWNRWKNKNGEM